jgi:hypothetical protein
LLHDKNLFSKAGWQSSFTKKLRHAGVAKKATVKAETHCQQFKLLEKGCHQQYNITAMLHLLLAAVVWP